MRAAKSIVWCGAICLVLVGMTVQPACGGTTGPAASLCDSAQLKLTFRHSNGQCVEFSGLSTSDEQANASGCDTSGTPCPTAGRLGTCNIPPSGARTGVTCVEAHLPRDLACPHPHVALGAALDLVALGFGHLRLSPRSAATADVAVPDNDAGAGKDAAKDLLHRRVLGPALAFRAREHEVAGRPLDGVLQILNQGLGDGQHQRLLALDGVAAVRAPDVEQPLLEIDILLA